MENENSFPGSPNKDMGQPSQTANGSASGIKREMNNLAADIGDLITTTTALAGDDLARAKSRLDAGLASLRTSIGKLGNDLAVRAKDTAKISDDYVHQKPWKAIGVGAALGLVIGFMLAARRG